MESLFRFSCLGYFSNLNTTYYFKNADDIFLFIPLSTLFLHWAGIKGINLVNR